MLGDRRHGCAQSFLLICRPASLGPTANLSIQLPVVFGGQAIELVFHVAQSLIGLVFMFGRQLEIALAGGFVGLPVVEQKVLSDRLKIIEAARGVLLQLLGVASVSAGG